MKLRIKKNNVKYVTGILAIRAMNHYQAIVMQKMDLTLIK